MSKTAFAILVLAAVVLGTATGLMAPLSESAKARAAAEIAPVDDAWRAALPRDPALATQAYLARLSPEARARSDAYFEGGYWLRLAGFVYGFGVVAALLGAGITTRVRDWIEARTRRPALCAAGVGAAYILLGTLLSLPLEVYERFFREHAFGLANQSFAQWLGDEAKGLAVVLVIGTASIVAIYAVVRRAPRTWWLWGALVFSAFQVLGTLLGPTYIDPIFNSYKPIADAAVRDPILSMARANGVPADNVYQFDASKQSHRISANVSGIFGVASIRLNDNLLNRTSLPEIKSVMAHEIGHYVLNHIYKQLVFFTLLLVGGFAFLKWAGDRALARWGKRLGLRDAADAAAMPLMVALLSVYMLLATPLVNTAIRVAEEEADIFGLNAAAEPDGFAEVDLKLSEYRKVDPGPIEEWLMFDHPSPRNRIYAAMRWKAEHPKP